jgi:hypothetical protein
MDPTPSTTRPRTGYAGSANTRGVTAWYLLAAETIDERIANLLQDKRHMVDSLTDGSEDVNTTLISSLISDYAKPRAANDTNP